jgi:hypothetical protein
MAIGYSASGATSEPSARYAGRLANDPLNTLAQGEAVMIAGGGHQTSSSGRWGDYCSLSTDPSDNLTLWQAHEYYSATSASAWNTRIGKFQFPAAPVAVSAVSRKIHGAAGPFDIPLPATGAPGIENRSGPVAGQHQIVVTFANAVTLNGAAVCGTGTLANFTATGGVVTVNLTGVADAQRMALTLRNVNDGTNVGDVVVPIGILLGDASGNGTVNSTDVSMVKSRSGQPITAANFRSDVVANGSINTSDIGQVKAQSGRQLP